MDGGAYWVLLDTPDLPDLVRQDGITPLGRYEPTGSLNPTWKHQMTKTLSLTVNANDILDSSKGTYRSDARTFRQIGFDHFVSRRIHVGFVKKFG
jgi:hypothetical protein